MLNRKYFESTPGRAEDFSIVLGGPLYRLLVRSGLIKPPFGGLASRLVVITGLAWLPLPILASAAGNFAGGVQIPFLYDFEVHARLLFALPLMIAAEPVVHRRMRELVQQFLERQIIRKSALSEFKAIVNSAMRLRNSAVVELALLLLVLIGGRLVWREGSALGSDSWYATTTTAGLRRTLAGTWYLFVSLPIFQFILLRWYFRIFIWARFLFQVSRLELNLVPIHPDRCCGMGFLGNVVTSFGPIVMAHSGLIAGQVANRVLHYRSMLPEYKLELGGMVLFLIILVLGPLCVFVPRLNSARFTGLNTYGPFASDYVIAFAQKWSSGGETFREPILGSADIQSLADLDSSYGIVKELKLVPFGQETFIRLLVFIALPLTPLLLTTFSLGELLERLVSIIF